MKTIIIMGMGVKLDQRHVAARAAGSSAYPAGVDQGYGRVEQVAAYRVTGAVTACGRYQEKAMDRWPGANSPRMPPNPNGRGP
jgi:hypothetical protein